MNVYVLSERASCFACIGCVGYLQHMRKYDELQRMTTLGQNAYLLCCVTVSRFPKFQKLPDGRLHSTNRFFCSSKTQTKKKTPTEKEKKKGINK